MNRIYFALTLADIQANSSEYLKALVFLLIALPAVYLVARIARRFITKRFDEHKGAIASKVIITLGLTISLLNVMLELGFDLTALLGAAGIASVAIGFASQTSLSNIISGIFLYWEKPFQIGDIIRVGDTSGVVQSIDLMSTKIRKFDNILVRIPNETLLKTTVDTVSKYPIRRMDINVGVAYKEDIDKVIEVLQDVADKNPFCLDEPKPLIIFKDFGDSSLNFMLGMWFQKTDFLALKNSIMKDIKVRFDAEGIEIPFPHRSLYSGSATDPFPIRIVNQDSTGDPASADGDQ